MKNTNLEKLWNVEDDGKDDDGPHVIPGKTCFTHKRLKVEGAHISDIENMELL